MSRNDSLNHTRTKIRTSALARKRAHTPRQPTVALMDEPAEGTARKTSMAAFILRYSCSSVDVSRAGTGARETVGVGIRLVKDRKTVPTGVLFLRTCTGTTDPSILCARRSICDAIHSVQWHWDAFAICGRRHTGTRDLTLAEHVIGRCVIVPYTQSEDVGKFVEVHLQGAIRSLGLFLHGGRALVK